MKKYLFRNDYSFGAHPKVLEAVCAVNLEGNHGYGDDGYTARAKERRRSSRCGRDTFSSRIPPVVLRNRRAAAGRGDLRSPAAVVWLKI